MVVPPVTLFRWDGWTIWWDGWEIGTAGRLGVMVGSGLIKGGGPHAISILIACGPPFPHDVAGTIVMATAGPAGR
jgi:hypothetical protein